MVTLTAPRARAPLAAAALVGIWLAVDITRQHTLGIDDAQTWFVVISAYVALAAALLIAFAPQQGLMGLLVVAWVAVSVGDDVAAVWPGSRFATTLLLIALAFQAPLFVHMALAYPSGRVRDRLERSFLVVAYVVSVAWEVPPALFVDASECPKCTPHASSLLFTGTTFDIRPIGNGFSVLFALLGAGFLLLIGRRVRLAPRGARRTLLPLALASVFVTAEFIIQRVAWLADWTAPQATLDWLGSAGLLVVPAAIFAGTAVTRRDRGPVGDLVVELTRARPGEIRAALARAVGDPSLELALWLPDQRTFVDEEGRPASVGTDRPDRAMTLIGPESDPVAAITHDPRLTGQRPLLEAVGSAARLALENARLQAALRAHLSELESSRRRITEAADTERRRLERDLHDGAQQRLLALGLALQLIADDGGDPELLAEAQTELQEALRELRELARGLHPAILTERGLKVAIAALVDRAPLPVVDDVPDCRYPANVESAVYFLVSEALANVAKHAHATRAAVTIRDGGGTLTVEIHDDGAGGATLRREGGLQGLSDRISAVGGRLQISSPPGSGTTLLAEIPCAS
jgi:signal transduction histidine kinase